MKLLKKCLWDYQFRKTNASNHTKCVLLSNQECMTEPTHINSHLNGYSQ